MCTNPGTSPTEGCVIDLAVLPIKAGACVDVDVARAAAGTAPGLTCASASDFSAGNRAAMVNPASPTNIPPALVAAYGSPTYTQIAEGDKCNNQSFVYTKRGSCESYGAPPPAPPAQTATYKMECQPGRRAVWNQFGYSTKVPGDSEVTFTATTTPTLPDGTAGAPRAPVTLATVKSSGGTDPAVCMGSSTGCPKNLFTLLGASAKYDKTLTLSVITTGTTALPTVDGWTITYNCVPANVE